MIPFGCEGAIQKTFAVPFDVPTTPTISTNPGAAGKNIYMPYIRRFLFALIMRYLIHVIYQILPHSVYLFLLH